MKVTSPEAKKVFQLRVMLQSQMDPGSDSSLVPSGFVIIYNSLLWTSVCHRTMGIITAPSSWSNAGKMHMVSAR